MPDQDQSLFIGQQNIIANEIKQRHLVKSPTEVGMIYYGKDGNSFAALRIGSEGQILQVVNGVPSWVNLAPPTGLAAARPTSGTFTGQMYFATDTNTLSIWNGAAWKSAVFV